MFFALSLLLGGTWAYIPGDSQASTDLVRTISLSSISNTSQPLYCGGCTFVGNAGVDFSIPVKPPAITTVSVVTNANGTTTSTFINSTANDLISSSYYPGGAACACGGGGIVTDNPQQIIVQAKGILSYGTISTIGGSTTCVGPRYPVSETQMFISLPTGYELPWQENNPLEIPLSVFSSYLTSILSGQPVPTSCTYDLPGEPVWQIPAQYLTTTVNINNVPASNTGSTTSSAPHTTSSAEAGPTTAVGPSSTSQPVSSPVFQSTSPVPNNPASSAPDIGTQISTSNPIAGSLTNMPAPSDAETPLTTKTPSSTEMPLSGEASSSDIAPSSGELSPVAETPLATKTLSSILTSGLVIGSQTLLPGSVIIYSGTTISLDTSDSAIIVGSSTISLASDAPPACATGSGPGFMIYSVINGCSSVAQSTPTATAQTGTGIQYGASWWNLYVMLIPAFYLVIG